MLVEFRVKNFKSIRDTQVLSMVASKDNSLEDTHVIKPEGASFNLLKSAAIYGPNAGGKSNLLQAMGFMQWSLLSRRTPSIPFHIDEYSMRPFFKLDTTSMNSPSEFEVTFLDKGVRYQYGFSLLDERVAEEWLLVYQFDKPQEWFRRTIDKNTHEDVYKFSSYFKGQKETWKKSTRKEALFLSVAAELNSEQLRPVFRELLKFFVLEVEQLSLPRMMLESYFKENTRKKKILLNFLSAADIGISDIDIKTEIFKVPKRVPFNRDETPAEFVEQEHKSPVFIHSHDGISERFEFGEESKGTQRLCLLAFYVLEALEQGTTIIIDELESSLHPVLTSFIVGLFNSADNKKGAQLIFTTHDTGLLDIKKTVRRDQIWFVEKDGSQATVLYSLTDFQTRKDAVVESGYLTGRYGAIPFVDKFIPSMDGSGNGA